jgi:hypothetical protein
MPLGGLAMQSGILPIQNSDGDDHADLSDESDSAFDIPAFLRRHEG